MNRTTVTFAEFMSALTALSLHRREKQAMLVGKVMEQLQKRLAGGDKERASADDIRAACRDAGHGSIDIGVLSPAGEAGALHLTALRAQTGRVIGLASV
jgi:hypothetical protein